MHRKYSTLLCRNFLYKASIEEDQGFKGTWLLDLKAVLDLEDLLLHLLDGFFCIHLIIGALRFSSLSLQAFPLSSSSSSSSYLFAGFGLFCGFSFIFLFTPSTIMDSGNSSSMQSSSGGGGGGDEEYDSRPENISPFLSPSLGFGSISNHPQPPPPQHLSHHQSHHHPPTLLDPSAQNLVSFSHSQANPNPNSNPNANSLYQLDLVWPRGLRSEVLPNYTDFGNLTGLSSSASSSSSSSSQSLSSSTQSLLGPNQGPFPSSSSSIPLPSSSVDGNGGGRSTTPRSDHHHQPNVVKNSRKRTRASRRAPTTVLTTDTTNFRQMVQEFTGIPAPPFSAALPYSRRLDLFGPGAAMRSAGGAHLDSLGPLYPFRPSAQKVSLLNSNMVDAGNNNPIAGPSSSTFTPSPPSNNYQSDLGLLPKQPQNMLNLQSPVLSFQTLLQSHPPPPPPKYPQPIFGSKSQAIPNSLDELGMSHHDHHQAVNPSLGGFPTHGSSFDGNNKNGGGGGGGGGDSQKVTGYKLNCAASTSEFHPEKGLENVFLKE